MKKYKLGDINMEEVALFIRDPKDDIEASVSYGHGAIFKHFPLGTPNESILNWGKDEFGRMFDEFCHLCDLGYVMDPEGDWMKIDKSCRIDVCRISKDCYEIRKYELDDHQRKIIGREISCKEYKAKSAFKAILQFEKENMTLESFTLETPRARDLLMGG